MRSSLLTAVLTVFVAGATAYAQPKQSPPPPPTVSCEFLEVSASSGDKPAVDADLEKLKKKFKKPPFSSWNVFKLQHREQKTLAQKKAETIKLKLGEVEAKLLGTANKSQLRLSISLDVNGKNIVNTTATVEAGDYLVYGHALPDNAGHLLALTCK
jgi:hypothetical protein